LDLSKLQPGQPLFSDRITVSAADAMAYLSATEDDGDIYAREHLVPPMAITALVMSAAMRRVELPAGAVHTSQELEFAAPVSEGEELECSASVLQNSVRRGTRFLALEVIGTKSGETVVSGKVSLAIPDAGEEGGDADAS
jgi:hypothetical protein